MSEAIVWTARIVNLQRHQKCLPASSVSIRGQLSNRLDCRPNFIQLTSQAIRAATEDRVSLQTPFLHVDKTAIAVVAQDLNVPIEQTWSCYKGGELHCGRCGTCVERIEAIYNAGLVDLTEYEPGAYEETLALLERSGKLIPS